MRDVILSLLNRLPAIAAVCGIFALCSEVKSECRKILKEKTISK